MRTAALCPGTDPAETVPTSDSCGRGGIHHARYIEADVPYHVISRIFQGRCLLVPTDELNELIVGVVGRALELFPSVVLFALTVLSNHLHAMLRGQPDQVSACLGFVKREISRRYGPQIGWSGTMWDEYVATALPTVESQVNCLKYLLSQAVKEGLVESPLDWPGVHTAKALLDPKPLRGKWFNATGYGRAVRKQRLRRNPKPVDKERFVTEIEVRLAKLPAWAELADEEYRREVERLVDEVIGEARTARRGRRACGARCVRRTPRNTRRSLPKPPWWEERRRMICWADPKAKATREYVARYWAFQAAFRQASDACKAGLTTPAFPAGAFRPARYCEAAGNHAPMLSMSPS